ncbi:TetR family transcriptional regulator [Pasteurella langaaensis DSM 22999]|uniref:TetR family transcriptional regulator n=1 Tax=Alitibacter langaaensis DSM 22999 TaxID=1122935 RepID=A0A2U0TA45_9PAST|nr:helix-turn-helix domain-containing protein [Pasteurella langaaensis]PVX40469.1 TetR family transcriptional regulator [Pasteurella langaaensis DSM 22999]
MLNKNDIRVIKTQKSIHHAFFTLLEQKDFQEITVQDILDAAQINRTTFYKHYASKYALAKSLVEDFKQSIFSPLLTRRFCESSLDVLKDTAPLFFENKDKIRLLWKIETNKVHLKQDMYHLIKDSYIETLKKSPLEENIDLEYQGHMYASLTLAGITFAVNCDQPVGPEKTLANITFLFERIIK